MKFLASILAATLLFAGSAFAQSDTEAGFDSFDLSLDSVNVDADLTNSDYEYIFDKIDKDSPDQVAAMIAAERTAWNEHVSKMDKWSSRDVNFQRSYRSGFRDSFHNGYRYANRYNYSYSYSYGYTNHCNAYRYSYWQSYNRNVRNSRYDNDAYRYGYGSSYRTGYSNGRYDSEYNNWN